MSALLAHLDQVGHATTASRLNLVGVDPEEIRRAVQQGLLRRVRRGAYITPAEDDPHGHETHRRTAVAIARGHGRLALTHESAALLIGLPVLEVPTCVQAAHLVGETYESSAGLTARPALAPAILAPLPPPYEDVLSVTPAAATMQVAARRGTVAGMVVADAVLRRGQATREDMHQTLAMLDAAYGRGRAALAADLASPLSESPGESRCRWLFHQLGLQQPEQQVELFDELGFMARVDFLFRRQRLVVEFDGRVKYGGDDDVMWREKRREQRLHQAGYRVLRLTWADLLDGRRAGRTLRSALAA